MPRPKLIPHTRLPYHVRARSNNREWFYLPKEDVWRICLHVLEKTIENYGLQLISFVLMDNHYHMLVLTPFGNLGDCMLYFGRQVSKQIGLESGRINRIFGGRYQRTIIEKSSYFRNAFKYVYRNPVEAGLCTNVEDYPFSTLRWEANRSPLPLSLPPDWMFNEIPANQEEQIRWLNEPFQGKQREIIRLGLRRQVFSWPKATEFKNEVASLELSDR